MRVLLSAPDGYWPAWTPALRAACPEMDLRPDGPPDAFDAIIYAPGGITDFTPYTNVRLVQSLWAGVERIIGNTTLTQPLARMVDPGLRQGMAEYCTGWTMRAHLHMDAFAQDGVWRNGQVPPLAVDRRVTVLGMGELGRAVATMLRGIGFDVAGWSASGRGADLAGAEGLPDALARAEVLLCLLPDTPDTRDLLNAARLAMLPRGAWIINPGRGTLINDDALLAALDAGQVGCAVLDVFRTEPLPPAHPFWSHPQVFVTPHIAAETRPASAAQVVAENLRRVMAGQPPLYLVDRARGY
ncbi:MAG: glyoxylate/hydroxypyruvate reductase A [Paracoccus sp. (in: a-proteobacteria)]|uniref:2-hydroxyacid dehydrogenase n=1 Tax=Paracoccus sp. TaxID=267 RepID=UPI0026E0F7E2|nr:glyoxylate/hydroxypyruvate reductase A [Paracoccus sp. (in: a-proteobacteria)]MDO5632724.1 glyoxylate/hydroxypyruvate reductase A [Paracoccus sp. (in: a-proteobacteria)]